VDYSADGGLYRASRSAGQETKLTRWADSPFGIVDHDGKDYWMFQGIPYGPTEHIFRLPHAGGEAKPVWTFRVKDPTIGSGVRAFAVDDQCFYYAMRADGTDYSSINAHRKPD
ncbi:MAG: hypothetical protein DRI90_28035, partial [Deltaproteobacteria bacterium]